MKRLTLGYSSVAALLLGVPVHADDRPIAIEIQVLQVSAERLSDGADLTSLTSTGIDVFYKGELPKGFAPLPEPPQVSLNVETQLPDGSTSRFKSDASGLAYVAADGAITLAGQTYTLGGGAEQPASPFRRIAAPRVALNPGQQAEIVMGRTLQYLEPVEGGLYRAVEAPDAFEGLKVTSTASRSADGAIRIDELNLTLSEVHSRARVPELGIEGGMPRMRSSTLSVQRLTIPDGMIGMVPFHDASKTPQVTLVVLISARDMPAQPAGKAE